MTRSAIVIAVGTAILLVASWRASAQTPAEQIAQPGGAWPPPGVHTLREPGVTPPYLVREIKPHYTFAALRAKIEGVVMLAFVVDADGSVGAIRVTRSLDARTGLDDSRTRKAN